ASSAKHRVVPARVRRSIIKYRSLSNQAANVPVMTRSALSRIKMGLWYEGFLSLDFAQTYAYREAAMKARTVEERLMILEAKDGAREAMFRYWRALDYKQWDILPDCFTEDAD